MLMFFRASSEIGSPGRSFIVDYLAQRLIEDLVAGSANLEGKVRILIIGGRVARIEAAHAVKKRFWNHQRCGRAVIHFAQIIVFRFLWIIRFAIVPSRCIAPYDSTCLLQSAVWINKL